MLRDANVLVDCSTDELFIDVGDGKCRPVGGSSGAGFDFVLRLDYPDNMWVDGDLDKVFSRLEKDSSIGIFVGYCVYTDDGYDSGFSIAEVPYNIGEPSAHIDIRTKYASYRVARDGTVTIIG